MKTKTEANSLENRYVKAVRDLKDQASRLRIDLPSHKQRLAYLHVSAALYHLYPYHIRDEVSFFRQVYYNEQLAMVDRQQLPEIAQQLIFTGAYERLSQTCGSGRILVSFHYGSFFATLEAFSAQGLDITAGMSPEVYTESKTAILHDAQRISNRNGGRMQLELLDMSDPLAIFKLVRKLRAGKDLFLFIDADSRQRVSQIEQRRIRVPFLDGSLTVSGGVAYLSYMTGAPLIPIISRRDTTEGNILIHFMDWIHPDPALTAETYAEQAIAELFRYLESRVRHDPTQWEGWLYIHNLLERQKCPEHPKASYKDVSSEEYMVNHQRYGLLAGKSRYYLFDRQHYHLLTIPMELFELLDDRCSHKNAIHADEQTMDYLFRHQILLPQTP